MRAAARMLRELVLEFVVHESTPAGCSTMRPENGEEAIRGFIDSGVMYHVAEGRGAMVGFAGILFHLFVDPGWHGQGVARRLWDVAREVAREAAIEVGGSGSFTVNASNYAVPVYEARGFVRSAPTQLAKEMYFSLMALQAN